MTSGAILAIGPTLGLTALLSLTAMADAGDDQPATPLNEVVMYAVDADTNELLRYDFSSDDYQVIGKIRDARGKLIQEIESLAYIPHGPFKGLYGVPTEGHAHDRLVTISLVDATARVYPLEIGFEDVKAMVPVKQPSTGHWVLYATQDGDHPGGHVTLCHRPPGNPDNCHTIVVGESTVPAHIAHGDTLGPCQGCDGGQHSEEGDDDDDDGDDDDDDGDHDENLIAIDPATGLATLVMAVGEEFEGLARGLDGMLYATTDDELWRIDTEEATVTFVGSHGFDEVEALEYAYGKDDPSIEVPGLGSEWTADGVLFGFSDESDALLIFNPTTGEAIQLNVAFDTPDCEGIIFLTMDPVSMIIASAYD